MSAHILDGKKIAADIRQEIKDSVTKLRKERSIVPGLGVLLVGENPASRSYVTAKERACEEAGIYSEEILLPASAGINEMLDVVSSMNANDSIHGILVQLPLPSADAEQEVIEHIVPEKDVDGFHPVNVGRMMLGLPSFLPCTPHGILQILKHVRVSTSGAHAVVVGRSNIVGRPLANMLSQKSDTGNATVTVCHTHTKELAAITRQADILIAAAGRPAMITGDMVKEGAVVIDVGVNRVEDPSKKQGYRLVGDVDFDSVKDVASALTPVPGGVGPMTITMLLFNTLEAARRIS